MNPRRLMATSTKIGNAGAALLVRGAGDGTLTDGTAQNKAANAVLTDNITINSDVLDENGDLITGKTFTQWTPIGDDSNAYTGTFDGDGHTISGLYYSGSGNYVGLFGLRRQRRPGEECQRR